MKKSVRIVTGALSAVRSHLKVLFIDDQPADILFEQMELERDGLSFESRVAATEPAVVHALGEFEPDVVLCDYSMPGMSGPRALETVQREQPSTPVIMVTESIPDELAVECLNWGATDVVLKSNLRRLGPAVRRAAMEAERRQTLEARVDELAYYDPVTGLPNLAFVHEAVECTLDRARAREVPAALVVLNVDRFHRIEECCGRAGADAVLRDIGATLTSACRGFDFAARIGSNDFLLVLSAFWDAGELTALVQRLQAAIAAPRRSVGQAIDVTASAGVALYPSDGTRFEDLLRHASSAMRDGRVASRGGLHFHSGDVAQRAEAQRRLESGLDAALRRDELILHYQTQFEVGSGRVCGVEALARWFPVGAASIAPSIFIPLAERTGLIGALGGWALRTACQTAADWLGSGSLVPSLSVNVSPQQICEGFTLAIRHALAASGLPAERLELEITEGVLVADPDLARKCMNQWKRLGVRIALDDFGTGYSSLSYLSRLPIDRLKIDGSLIHAMVSEAKDATIVRAMIALSRDLGITVIAECVETEKQLKMLEEFGCEQAQGYLLTPPQPAAEAQEFLIRSGTRTPARLAHAMHH